MPSRKIDEGVVEKKSKFMATIGKLKRFALFALCFAPFVLSSLFAVYISYGRKGIGLRSLLQGFSEFLLIIIGLLLTCYLFDALIEKPKRK